MKPACFQYFAPSSLEEAVALRASHPGGSLLAGGQSLVPIMNFRLARPDCLIDLGGLRELAYVHTSSEEVVVGAMTRQRELERDAAACHANPLIRETLQLVAHAVIRNRGTIGGSIAHADPAAELPALLTCLDGTAEVVGPEGRRRIPASSLFTFHLTTSIELDEILISASFPALPSSAGWAFSEVSRRHGDFALAGVCCVLQLDGNRGVEAVRLAACGISSIPQRLVAAEEVLAGSELNEAAVREAGMAASAYVTAQDETQASTAYRQGLVETLVRRAVSRAADRAKERR